MSVFRDRADAGRQLAARLAHYGGRANLLVLGLPRGGVPVAAEIARELHAPLDVFVVRKLGVPGQEELAFGAIASGGDVAMNETIRRQLAPSAVEAVMRRERAELARREHVFRPSGTAPAIIGRIVFLVDDGIATGATMRAAASVVRSQHPDRLVVAVPVAAAQTTASLGSLVDEFVSLVIPTDLVSVGQWYGDFSQTTDDEVRALLAEAAPRLQRT